MILNDIIYENRISEAILCDVMSQGNRYNNNDIFEKKYL